jgi:serine/threonine-protein kinase HipA
MRKGKFDIYVYADWIGLEYATLIGMLSAHFAKGKKAFSFEYDKNWLNQKLKKLAVPLILFSPADSIDKMVIAYTSPLL